jgi:hypothetical protein
MILTALEPGAVRGRADFDEQNRRVRQVGDLDGHGQ